uniref:SCO-spondin-like n=1 Tax=Nyctereutes procyonoides TaxID=34880 RepID=UPI002443BF9D|nr:SCO-spondin-like [Nyctereutes procyonoides]
MPAARSPRSAPRGLWGRTTHRLRMPLSIPLALQGTWGWRLESTAVPAACNGVVLRYNRPADSQHVPDEIRSSCSTRLGCQQPSAGKSKIEQIPGPGGCLGLQFMGSVPCAEMAGTLAARTLAKVSDPLSLVLLPGCSQPRGPHGEERLAGSFANSLPRHQRCKARLFLTEHSLPGSQRLHPTPPCRCAGELTAAPQACPAHLIIHSSTALPPSPVLGNKKGGLQLPGNRATFCVLPRSVLASTPNP